MCSTFKKRIVSLFLFTVFLSGCLFHNNALTAYATLEEKVLRNYSFDVFHIPAGRDEEIHILFDTVPEETYAKYISRGFDDKAKAMNDRNVVSTKCFLCHKNLRKKLKWFTPNGKHYYSVSYCDRHGFMKSKIRIRKAENEQIYVVKTAKFISEEEVENIISKQEKAKQQRKEKRISKNQNHRS